MTASKKDTSPNTTEKRGEGRYMTKQIKPEKPEQSSSETKAPIGITRSDLPDWFTSKAPESLLHVLEQKGVMKEFEPGTTRARIVIKDPPYKGTNPGRQRTASKKVPLGESWKVKRRWPEEETD